MRDAVALPKIQLAPSLSSNAVTTSFGVVSAGKYDISSAAADVVKIGPGKTGFVAHFLFEITVAPI